jgi:hypothetical protein
VNTLLGLTEVLGPEPEAIPIATRPELAGERRERRITADGDELAIVVVALTDRRYDYVVRMIAPVGSDEDWSVFDKLLASIEPIPLPASKRDLGAVSFWCG